MDFYKERIDEIRKMISEGAYEKARKEIHEELMIAYVPGYVEEEFKWMLDEIDAKMPVVQEGLKEEEILSFLKGDEAHQRIAVNALDRMNIREYLDVVEEYLLSDGDDDVKCILVTTLIDQEVSQEIKMKKSGVDFAFIPRYIMKVEESDGFLKAKEHFGEVFLHDASKYAMAMELMTREAYRSLPINLEEEEGEMIAHNIMKHLYRLFEEEEALEEYEEVYEKSVESVH